MVPPHRAHCLEAPCPCADNGAHGAIATVKDLPAIQANLSVHYESREPALGAAPTCTSACALHRLRLRLRSASFARLPLLRIRCCYTWCFLWESTALLALPRLGACRHQRPQP